MAWIEIGAWWQPKRMGQSDHLAVLLMHPIVCRQPDGSYEFGWQPMIPDLFPTPF